MKYRFSAIMLFHCTLFAVSAVAGPSYGEDVGMGSRIGFSVNVMRNPGRHKPFYGLAIPQLEVDLPIVGEYIQIELGWGIQWGLTKFYIDHFPDFLPSLGLRVYPNGKYLSVFGNGSWGTFVFNNSTLTAEAGAEFEIPVSTDGDTQKYIALGASVFHREVNGLANFLERYPWRLTTDGVAIRVGFRGRVLE